MQFEWQLTDFVKEDGRTVGDLEAARLPGKRSGKGPLLASEQFGLDQSRRERGAVHLDHGAVFSSACIVDGLRQYLLAGSGLPEGKSKRESWFYFTENEPSPGAFRWHQFKFVFNLRGDDGQATGGLAVDSNLGWKGAEKYVATAPQIFDLLADPQERYDTFMNNFTESTWTAPVMVEQIKNLMLTYVKYPRRKLQSGGYTGPITITNFQKFQWLREQLGKEGFSLGLPGQ